MIDFKKLKANSGKKGLEELNKKLAEQERARSGADSYVDERYWQPTVDKAGNGAATIRFLSAPMNEDLAFVQLWEHAFKNDDNGKWYIEKSRTTLGKSEKDPVKILNDKLWVTKDKANEAVARKQNRKDHKIANIYVVNDPGNPENNGKVFLFKYGKTIHEKIMDKMTPEFDEEGRTRDADGYSPQNAYNPFDMWEGANFNLRVRKVEGYRNYDKSEFAAQSVLFKDDSKIEAVWKQAYSLAAEIAPDKFKSFEELEKRLHEVLDIEAEEPNHSFSTRTPTPRVRPNETTNEVNAPFDVDESEDEDRKHMEFLRNLANDSE